MSIWGVKQRGPRGRHLGGCLLALDGVFVVWLATGCTWSGAGHECSRSSDCPASSLCRNGACVLPARETPPDDGDDLTADLRDIPARLPDGRPEAVDGLPDPGAQPSDSVPDGSAQPRDGGADGPGAEAVSLELLAGDQHGADLPLDEAPAPELPATDAPVSETAGPDLPEADSAGPDAPPLDIPGRDQTQDMPAAELPAPVYSVVPECPASTACAAFGCPGGVIFDACAELDALGRVVVRAHKRNGEVFRDGFYFVKSFAVDAPVAQQCTDASPTVASDPAGEYTSTLEFPPFDPGLAPGEVRAYCASKWDGTSTAYWCSGRFLIGRDVSLASGTACAGPDGQADWNEAFFYPEQRSRVIDRPDGIFRVESRADAERPAISLRVCRLDTDLPGPLHVIFHDWATHTRFLAGTLAPADGDPHCSDWAGLDSERLAGLGEGDSLYGPVQLVYPALCTAAWDDTDDCNRIPGTPCGDCWSSPLDSMTRTSRPAPAR